MTSGIYFFTVAGKPASVVAFINVAGETCFAGLWTSATCFPKAALWVGFESRVKAFLHMEQRLTPFDSIK
jgi:hypothetical protein